MSEKNNEAKSEQKNNTQNDLEGIDVDFLVKVDKVNGKFFETLENLKEARPTFQGIDDAFLSVSENLLNAYQLVYRLLYEQYRGDIERLIAYFEAKNDRIIPFRWKKWWQRRFRQNQAMDLVDREADYEVMSAFAMKEHELYEKYMKASNGEQSDDAGEKWEVVGELAENPTEGAEQAENEEEIADAELSKVVQESPQNASEGAEQSGNEAEAGEEDQNPPKKQKKEKKAFKEQKAEKKSSKNASVSDSDSEEQKKDREKVEGFAEKAPESVSEGAPEEPTQPKKSKRKKKDKKGGKEDDDRKGNQN